MSGFHSWIRTGQSDARAHEPMHTEPWSFVLEEAQASAVVETGSPRAIAGLCELKQLYNVSGISTVKAKER